MARQILVLLKKRDRIEEILPYLERIAQPGMKVIFLVHSTVDSSNKFLDVLISIHALGIRPEFLPLRDSEKQSIEASRRLVQEKISSTCEALYRTGAKIEAGVYTGRFEEVVRECMHKEDVQLIVLPNKRGNRLSRFLRKILCTDSWFKPMSLPPVLLLHPSHIAGRHG